MSWKRALVSVSDKTGLIDLLNPLVAEGLEIVSTGGTAQYLRENKFTVIDVSEVTKFPEVLDGRVKTLNPMIHMGLLAKKKDANHQSVLQQFKVEMFDLVIVNLYPFEEALMQNASFDQLIEKIDIGGPSMLRSAAKNFQSVTVLCDPNDYKWFLENRTSWSEKKSQKCAAKVFSLTSSYDAMIASALTPAEQAFSERPYVSFGGRLVQGLRYGENPQQQAAWFRNPFCKQGLFKSKIIQGKELSYNNLLDLDAAVSLVKQFTAPTVVAVKHNNPCGVATDENSHLALQKALKADPISVFGGILALNFKVEEKHVESVQDIFLECIIAPGWSTEALEILSKKKNLRILEWPEMNFVDNSFEIKSISGGFLIQTKDQSFDSSAWKIVGENLNDRRQSDFAFGEKVCASLKSNAVALVANGQTLGLGMGQVNRIDALNQAIIRWRTHHPHVSPEEVSVISDAFFPFKDSIDLIAQNNLRWILQPGGALRDEEVLKAAQEKKMSMVLTGVRHFKH